MIKLTNSFFNLLCQGEALSSLAQGNAPRNQNCMSFQGEALTSLAQGNALCNRPPVSQAPTGRNQFSFKISSVTPNTARMFRLWAGFLFRKNDSAPLGLVNHYTRFRRALPYANDERASPCFVM